MSFIYVTIQFESPFWVGIFERQDGRDFQVARVVFGSEPTSPQLYEFLLHGAYRLPYGRRHKAQAVQPQERNPKRVLREAQKVSIVSRSTKAQAALQADFEAHKREVAIRRRDRQEEQKEQNYALRCQKAKAKHRGH